MRKHQKLQHTEQQRTITVSTRWHQRGRKILFLPLIRFSGWWLERAGFARGQRVQIEIAPGRLVLTHAAEDERSGG